MRSIEAPMVPMAEASSVPNPRNNVFTRVFDSQKRGAASGRISMPSSRQTKGITQIREGTKVGCSIQPGVYLILN